MPRKPAVARAIDDEDRAELGKFLDNLPQDANDPKPDDLDDEEPTDDEDEDDGDDDDDGEPVPLPLAASVAKSTVKSGLRELPDDADDDDNGVNVLVEEPKRRGRPPKANGSGGHTNGGHNGGNTHVAPANRPGVRTTSRVSPEAQSRSPTFRAMREFQETAYQEIDSLLASLNFDKHAYTIQVERLDPVEDEDGVSCTGFLQTYKKYIQIEDVKKDHGGGTFLIRINGPRPNGTGSGFIKQERITIAAPPRPMGSYPGHKKKGSFDEDANANGRRNNDVSTLVEAQERSNQRMFEVLERKQSEESVLEKLLGNPTFGPLLEKFLSKGEDSTKAMLDAQREDRRLEMERRREDERKADERRREDEERRREDRENERRREEERKAELIRIEDRRREDERKADERRAQDERDRRAEERDRMKEEAQERQRQHERELAAAQDRSRQDALNQQRQMEMMAASSKQTTEMLMQTMSFQLDSMDKRNNGGGVETLIGQMLALKNLQNTLTGADVEPSTLEKITEGLEKVVTTIAPIASQAWNATRKPAQLNPPTPTQPGPRPIVVDLGPVAKAALPANVPANAATPAAPVANPGTPPVQGGIADAAGAAPTETQPEVVAGPEDPKNELTVLPTFPPLGAGMIEAGTLLIQNVDLAVQRGLTAEQLVDTVLDPFQEKAPMIMAMAGGLDADGLREFITSNVPPSWAILSPRGEALVAEAFELFTSEDGEEG